MREFLLLHPNISSNKDVGPGYFEEAQFFGGSSYPKGVEWYRQLFAGKNSSLLFEKSANYFDNPRAAEAVHHLIPDAKIIVILIDPTERAFSWFQVTTLRLSFIFTSSAHACPFRPYGFKVHA